MPHFSLAMTDSVGLDPQFLFWKLRKLNTMKYLLIDFEELCFKKLYEHLTAGEGHELEIYYLHFFFYFYQ